VANIALTYKTKIPILFLKRGSSYQKESDMKKQRGFLCSAIALAIMVGIVMLPPYALSAPTTAMGAPDVSSAKKVINLAALTQEQMAACEQERQALLERLKKCTTDECRRDVQKDIDAHNARCQ
jgi:hypothetical protein